MKKTLNDFKINELHLYMKFKSFTGQIGEIVKLEKMHMETNSIRDPNLEITILWANGEQSDTTYEAGCQVEYIHEEVINYYPNEKS